MANKFQTTWNILQFIKIIPILLPFCFPYHLSLPASQQHRFSFFTCLLSLLFAKKKMIVVQTPVTTSQQSALLVHCVKNSIFCIIQGSKKFLNKYSHPLSNTLVVVVCKPSKNHQTFTCPTLKIYWIVYFAVDFQYVSRC